MAGRAGPRTSASRVLAQPGPRRRPPRGRCADEVAVPDAVRGGAVVADRRAGGRRRPRHRDRRRTGSACWPTRPRCSRCSGPRCAPPGPGRRDVRRLGVGGRRRAPRPGRAAAAVRGDRRGAARPRARLRPAEAVGAGAHGRRAARGVAAGDRAGGAGGRPARASSTWSARRWRAWTSRSGRRTSTPSARRRWTCSTSRRRRPARCRSHRAAEAAHAVRAALPATVRPA